MRGFLIFLVVIGVVGYFSKDYIRDHQGGLSIDSLISASPEKAAESRVKQILDNLKKEGDIENRGLQTAICLWDSDKIVLENQAELEAAYDAFNAWRDEFGINQRKISDFTVTGSELTQKSPPVVTVSGTIEGRSFKMRVPDERRISWTL
ncbi:MAG: hypothetical protein ACJ75H_22810 [Thermoanaerobaculia bacterium]